MRFLRGMRISTSKVFAVAGVAVEVDMIAAGARFVATWLWSMGNDGCCERLM